MLFSAVKLHFFSDINNVVVLMITPCCKIETFTAVTLCSSYNFSSPTKRTEGFYFYLGSQKSCIKSYKRVWVAVLSNEKWQHIRGLSRKGFGSLSAEENFSHEL